MFAQAARRGFEAGGAQEGQLHADVLQPCPGVEVQDQTACKTVQLQVHVHCAQIQVSTTIPV